MNKLSFLSKAFIVLFAFFYISPSIAPLLQHTDTKSTPELKQIKAIGSIQAGTNQLLLTTNAGFRTGDVVLIETGGEAGKGKRGTRGVGGQWPYKSYPTIEAMKADKNPTSGIYAWVEATGDTYRGGGKGEWTPYTQWHYYAEKAIPMGLRATVTSVSEDGKRLTLDAKAQATSTGATVYFDNEPVINALKGTNIVLPAGHYAIGEKIRFENRTNLAIKGAGMNKTTLFSPKGFRTITIDIQACTNARVSDFEIVGNFKTEGFGYAKNAYPKWNEYFENPNVGVQGLGFFATVGAVAERIRVKDVATYSLQAWGATNTWFRNCEVILTDYVMGYIGWNIHFTGGCVGGGAEDILFDSKGLAPSFESFNSTGQKYNRIKVINGTFALNAAGGIEVNDLDITYTKNCAPPNKWNIGSGAGEVNVLVGAQNAGMGTIIRNMNIRYQGIICTEKPLLQHAFMARVGSTKTQIIGGSYIVPEGTSGKGRGIMLFGENNLVDGWQTNLNAHTEAYTTSDLKSQIGPWNAMLSVQGKHSVVKNTKADFFAVTPDVAMQNNKGKVIIVTPWQ